MKYLKKFDTHSEYEQYIGGGNPELPNVSICMDLIIDPHHVHYNKLKEIQPNDEIWYTTTDGLPCAYNLNCKCYGDFECTDEIQIISNTYENGLGILKFSKPVVSIGNQVYDDWDFPDYPYEEFGDLFKNNETLKTLTLPEGLRRIGYNFAYYASALTDVYFPDSLEEVGNYAFYANEAMTAEGNHIYYYGSEKNGKYVLCGDGWAEEEELTEFTVKEGTFWICSETFFSSVNLKKINLPNTIRGFSNLAFDESGLETFTFPENSYIKHIPDRMLGDTKITALVIPSSIKTIGDSIIENCVNLTSVTCLAPTPPTIIPLEWYGGSFYGYDNHPFYVPPTSMDAYKAADGWSDYADNIQAIP